MLTPTLIALMVVAGAPARAQSDGDSRALVRSALEAQATFPAHLPTLPDVASDRAAEALRVRGARQATSSRAGKAAERTSSVSEESVKGGGNAKAKGAASNASVHAAEQAAAGQARAAEAKKARKNSQNPVGPNKP